MKNARRIGRSIFTVVACSLLPNDSLLGLMSIAAGVCGLLEIIPQFCILSPGIHVGAYPTSAAAPGDPHRRNQ